QMAPDVPVYNELVTIYRQGALDVAVLKRCLNEIVRRHEAWRTTFQMVKGQPVQIVHPPTEVDLPVLDLRELPKAERAAEALRLASEQTRKPFDLSTGPLVRTMLLRLDDEDYQLCVSLHHIVFDGLSVYRVLLPELLALYRAFSRNDPSGLPELAIQY